MNPLMRSEHPWSNHCSKSPHLNIHWEPNLNTWAFEGTFQGQTIMAIFSNMCFIIAFIYYFKQTLTYSMKYFISKIYLLGIKLVITLLMFNKNICLLIWYQDRFLINLIKIMTYSVQESKISM
jgi:hypothetical protein